jgi:hypothetical protein
MGDILSKRKSDQKVQENMLPTGIYASAKTLEKNLVVIL